MLIKTILTHLDINDLAHATAKAIDYAMPPGARKVYAIPRGGVPALYAVQATGLELTPVNDPAEANFFLDDIINTGGTMEQWCEAYPERPFFALVDKTDANSLFLDAWVVFPWEAGDRREQDDSIVGTIINRIKEQGKPFYANDNISKFIAPNELGLLKAEVEKRAEHLLRGLVIDLDNDHNTVGTAHRVAKMYIDEVFKGRYQPAPVITDFPNAKGLDEMYMSGPITVRSTCSHHFVPIVGRCWIGIIPGDRVIGLSKFNRIVEWVASRPQIQEELVMQIADYIEQQISPKGLAVVVEATHMCMTWRGVREPLEAKMTTNVMRGAFRDKPEARAEFMTLVAKA